jgi:hypothetical protein
VGSGVGALGGIHGSLFGLDGGGICDLGVTHDDSLNRVVVLGWH